jgi:hypothetical protein
MSRPLQAPVGLNLIYGPPGGTLVGRQVSTVQRAELEYLRSRGIESTPTRSKDSEEPDPQVGTVAIKLVLWLRNCGTERDPGV